MGALCYSSTRATHHALQEAFELSAATRKPGSASYACQVKKHVSRFFPNESNHIQIVMFISSRNDMIAYVDVQLNVGILKMLSTVMLSSSLSSLGIKILFSNCSRFISVCLELELYGCDCELRLVCIESICFFIMYWSRRMSVFLCGILMPYSFYRAYSLIGSLPTTICLIPVVFWLVLSSLRNMLLLLIIHLSFVAF